MISIFKKSKVEFPSGVIVAWYGVIADIPTGWLLCDGTYGTPDLKEKFIRGANVDGDVGDAVGSDSHHHRMDFGNHSHTFDDGGHSHTFDDGGHTHRIDFGNHSHSFDDGGHYHELRPGVAVAGGTGADFRTEVENASGTTGAVDLDKDTYSEHATGTTGTKHAEGTTDDTDLDKYTANEDNIPVSRKLFWIMKA